MKNVNIGVLGHVDSGKTSLCRTLSTTGSTAAFDSSPQSKERGITLDLGFSSFKADDKWNFTLVDCPGHASLIRTVIGGAQIMDIMLLVVDVHKGIQPQTAECLILAQITSNHLVVVLNKTDGIPLEQRTEKINKIKKLMRTALSKTKFGDAPIVSVSAIDKSVGTEELRDALLDKVQNFKFFRDVSSPFLMAVDHCFAIKGQGTIVTGTVLQGIVTVNDMVEFPSIAEQKKVKSMQSFHVPVDEAVAGDRVGICFPGLNASLIERTIISAPKLINCVVRAAIITLERIPYFKKPVFSQRKYHITIGYYTITARVVIFRTEKSISSFDTSLDYNYLEELDVTKSSAVAEAGTTFAVLEFDCTAMITPNSLVIGSDLQSDVETVCRLAFFGRILGFTEDKLYKNTFLPSIKVFRNKMKEGKIDRIQSDSVLIVKKFCTKESKIDHLINLKVSVHSPIELPQPFLLHGKIESRFGKTIRVRVLLDEPMTAEQLQILNSNMFKCPVVLRYKRYLYNQEKGKLFQ